MALTQRTADLFDVANAIPLSRGIMILMDLASRLSDRISPPAGLGVLDNIGAVDFHRTDQPDFETYHLRLLFATELALELPGLDGTALVLGSNEIGGTIVDLEVDDGPSIFALRIIGDLALRFSRQILKPARWAATGWEELPDAWCEIRATITLTVDGDGEVSISGPATLSLPPALVGGSGVVVQASNVMPVFSDKSLPPDAQAPIGAGWRGVFIESANVYLPAGLAPPAADPSVGGPPASDLAFDHCYIGSGGFTGRLTKNWTEEKRSLFGMDFTLNSATIEFRQSIPVETEIKGTLTLPFFEGPVDVEIGIGLNGAFLVGLSETGGLQHVVKAKLLDLEIDSIGFEVKDGLFTAKLSGKLTPLFGADKGLKWPAFDVKELSIDSKGHVHLDGGWLDLPRQQTLDFYGFKIEITQLGFGKNDDGGKWIGFSGGLKLVDGLKAGASVEGLRITWYEDGRDPKISLNGAGVELSIPDVLYLKGEVSFRELTGEGGETIRRFDGDIHLSLETPELEIDGTLVIGSVKGPAGRYNFFAIYVDVELPTGIPLASTGLGIYGFAGLFALQMEPDKHSNEMWFSIDHDKSFYHRDTPGITDLKKKWVPQKGSFAVGAGITLGTLADNGYTFNGKFLLAIVIPGPIILIQGAAQFLKKRADGDREGEFRALAVIDGRQGSLTIGLDAAYKTGSGGELIEIGGSMEAFYAFHDPTAWHLYLGRDEPRSLRIRAIFARLVEANAYFMIDAHQLALGAWFGYAGNWSFGPLSVTLEAWAEGNARISFKPVQFHGDLWLHCQVGLHVFGFGLDLSVDARIAADLFKPYHLVGTFSVGIKLPWPFKKKIGGTVTLEWGPQRILPRLPLPVADIAVESLKSGVVWPLRRGKFLLPDYDDGGFLRLGDDAFVGSLLPADTPPLVPLDGRIAITFGRAVQDLAQIGFPPNNPGAESIGTVPVTYVLDSLALDRWDGVGNAWLPVARSPQAGSLSTLFGTWVPVPALPTSTPTHLGQTKLLLWSKTPFDFARHSGSAWEEWVSDTLPDYPCPPVLPTKETCFGFDRLAPGSRVDSPWTWPGPPAVTLSWGFGAATVGNRTATQGGVARTIRTLCFPDRAAQAGVTIRPEGPAAKYRLALSPAAGTAGTPLAGTAAIAPRVISTVDSVPTCSDLRRQKAGTLGNPWRTAENLRFTVRGADGQPLAVSRIERWGTSPLGLNAGFELDVELPCASPFVELLVTHRPPFRIVAFNASGTAVATHAPNGNGGEVTETIRLEGPAITRLEVHAADNEKLVHRVCFLCAQPSGPQATVYDGDDQPHGPFVPIGNVITIAGQDLTKVVVTDAAGAFCLEQICVTPDPEAGRGVGRAESIQHMEDELLRWQLDGAVFAPNTGYRLTVQTHLVVSTAGFSDAPTAAALAPREFAYFRTEGPPGLTKLLPPDGVPKDRFDSGLDDLTRYVHETDPPTVPPPGQKPLLFKPFYRAYDVGVEFNEDYVEQMYAEDRRNLGLYLFDNSNQPVRDARGRLLALAPSWQRTETLTLKESETRWLTLIDAATCLPGQPVSTKIPHDATLVSAEERVLAADTLHEARLQPLLLHETFTAGDVGHPPPGWAAADDGLGGASQWRLGETGEPSTRYVEQTSAVGSAIEPARPGTVLLLTDPAGLAVDDPARPSRWTDVRASVYVRVAAGGAVGIVLRYGGPGSWYRFALDERGRRLVKAGADGISLLAQDSVAHPRNRDFLLTFEALGSDLRAYVDGEPVFAVTDGKPADLGSLAQGRVGLYTCQSPGARFADLRVDDFRLQAPVAYRFQFTTSFYANFYHHLHGFDDAPWSGALVPDTTVPDVSVPLGLAVLPSLTPPAEAETRAYEALAKLALGEAAALQRSTRVEVTRLTRPGGAPVLLLRSPEPLDWQRVELTLSRLRYALPTPARPGTLKLTDVTFGTLHPAEEAVTVLLREAVEPTRQRIEVRQISGPVVEPAGDPILFLESFRTNAADAALAGFTIVDAGTDGASEWRIEGGALLQLGVIAGGAEPELPGTMALTGDPGWTDCRLTADLGSGAGSSVGIVFRYQDADNFYRLSADATLRFRRLVRRAAGVVSILWEDAGRYALGEPFRLEVEAVGPRLTGYLDGARLFSVSDATHAAGGVGLYAWNDPTFRCERIEVRLPSLDGQALFADAFATGDLTGWTLLSEVPTVPLDQAASWETADGALHLRSLQAAGSGPEFPGALAAAGDPAWTDAVVQVRLRSKGGAIGVVFRQQSPASFYRFAMNHARKARQLIRKSGGQLQVLWQDDIPYEVDRPYELTVLAVGPSLRGYLDGVPLFAVEDTDPAAVPAGRIALYAWNNPEAWFSTVRVWPADRAFAGWTLDEPFRAAVPGRWSFLAENGQPDPLPWSLGGGALAAAPEPVAWEAPGAGVDGTIHALAVAGGGLGAPGDLYVGGDLKHAGGIAAPGVALWQGGAWKALGAGVAGTVSALAVEGDRVYVGGTFTSPGRNVAVWNRAAGTWSTLGAGIDGQVLALAVAGDRVYAGGQFTHAGTAAASNLAVWDGHAWSAVGGGVDGPVQALAARGGRLYVGGRFRYAGGKPVGRITLWDGTSWTAIGAANGPVSALALEEGDNGFYMGGAFTQVGGVAAARIVRGTGKAWVPLGSGVDNSVDALLLDGNQLWVAGRFISAGGAPANRIARFNLASQTWSPVGDGLAGAGAALAQTGDRLWVGGEFPASTGVPAARLAALRLGGTRFALTAAEAPAAFRLAVRLVLGTDGAAAVVLSYADADHHLALWLDAEHGQRRLVRTAGGPGEVLWQDAVQPVAGHEYAVTLDAAGDRLTGYLDGVLLCDLAVPPVSANGGRFGLALRRSPDARGREVRLAEPGGWTTWYAFGEEEGLLAGTRVRIHGGLPAPAPSPEPGVVLRSVAPAGEAGRLRLRSQGPELRLVASDGTLGHARAFLGPEAYVPVTMKVLRKADGTALILLPEGDAGAGPLRLQLTYYRERSAAGRTFRQAGDKSPEVVTLDIP